MKTIFITGASSGFGKLTIPLLLDAGHAVIAGIRGGDERLREVFPQHGREIGVRLFAVDLHMDRFETFESATRLVQERFEGKLDVLINNAGLGLFGALEDQDPAQFRQFFDVNFFGQVFLTKAMLPMLRAARGRVLMISSVAGLLSFPMYGSYSASKFAIEAMYESLWYEMRPFGVQVCLIEPGAFRTSFNTAKSIALGAENPTSMYHLRSQKLDHFQRFSTKRQGDPQVVARLIARYCEKSRIPLRRPVGLDCWVMSILGRVLPGAIRTRVEYFVFRKIVFKD